MTDPDKLYQHFLDISSQALWDQDYELLADTMAYPHDIGTMDRLVKVADRDELIRLARDFRANLGTLGATAYYRVGREASFISETEILGTHMVYALRGATPVIEPFKSEMVLVRETDGEWRGGGIITQARNADVRINVGQPRIASDTRHPLEHPVAYSPDRLNKPRRSQ